MSEPENTKWIELLGKMWSDFKDATYSKSLLMIVVLGVVAIVYLIKTFPDNLPSWLIPTISICLITLVFVALIFSFARTVMAGTRKTIELPENGAPLKDIQAILHACAKLCARVVESSDKGTPRLLFLGMTLGMGIAHEKIPSVKDDCTNHDATQLGKCDNGSDFSECMSKLRKNLKLIIDESTSHERPPLLVTLAQDKETLVNRFLKRIFTRANYRTFLNSTSASKRISQDEFLEDLANDISKAHSEVIQTNPDLCKHLTDNPPKQLLILEWQEKNCAKKACVRFDMGDDGYDPKGTYKEDENLDDEYRMVEHYYNTAT